MNMHEPSGWCVKSEFVHGEVSNPIKVYRGKDCVEKFCKHIISEAKRLHGSFRELPMSSNLSIWSLSHMGTLRLTNRILLQTFSEYLFSPGAYQSLPTCQL